MTENTAIEELKEEWDRFCKSIPCDTTWGMVVNEAYKTAIKALEEIQQYRSIGTISECREAVEKQRAKKPVLSAPCKSINYYLCPQCRDVLYINKSFCCNCGSLIDWSEESV